MQQKILYNHRERPTFDRSFPERIRFNTMKLSIMQPYFLPYLGYWQLIASSDTFVIYDDVNFIKGGWINRNRYLYQGQPKYFNITMSGASPNKKINEVGLMKDPRYNPGKKLLSTFQMAYQKAPMYRQILPLLEEVLLYETDMLAPYLEHSIRSICQYLELPARILISSQIKEKDCSLTGKDKVINICQCLGADTYINASGGRELYHQTDFQNAGIQLYFIEMEPIEYPQFGDPFVPGLSIVDVLMFNEREQVQEMLKKYQLKP